MDEIIDKPMQWLEFSFLGNSLLAWSISLAVLLGAWIALGIAARLMSRRLGRLAERSDKMTLKIAHRVGVATKSWFLFLVALYIASRPLSLQAGQDAVLNHIVIIGLLIQLGLWCSTGLTRLFEVRRERQLKEDPGMVAALDIIGFAARVGVWTTVFLLSLDNLGVDITALIAGLGVGGIAIALAAQNVVADLFASLSIVLDKPFVVGDFLIIGDLLGSVEHVGLKTTRLRSLSGEQIVFSNTDLLNSRIRNYGRMLERRVVFSLGVVYQTPHAQLEAIPGIIRKIVTEQEDARFDRAHFQRYGDFSLVFEVVYYVLSADYNRYMDIQQSINLEIYKRFEESGIQFAYPTQSLYVMKAGGAEEAAAG